MEDVYSIIIILSILLYIALAAIPATIARNKGYISIIFFMYGFFLWPICMIHLAFLPNKFDQAKKDEMYEYIKLIASSIDLNNEKKDEKAHERIIIRNKRI